MAFMKILLSLIPLFSNALLIFAIVESPKTITLRLIHPFSPHSPFYPGNLTEAEKVDLLIQGQGTSMHHPFSTIREGNWNGNSEVDDIVAQGKYSGFFFVAQVNIGSFSGKGLAYFLVVDTGSSVTWVQCVKCNPCFNLSQPNFPYESSQSYRLIPCGDPTCPTPVQQCFKSSCGFRLRYGSGSGPSTVGKIVRETLQFPSSFGGLESYNNLFLGCGLQNNNFKFVQPNGIAGILGLGRKGLGILPLWAQAGKKRFSYCFYLNARLSSWLYIGGEKMEGPQVQKTPLLGGSNPSLYYLDLQDISIQNIRIGLHKTSIGDCFIDVGAQLSYLGSNVYTSVKAGIIHYFAQFHIPPYGSGGRPKGVPAADLCFPNHPGFTRFPTMTFHFKGADLVFQPSVIFLVGNNYICFLFKTSSNVPTVLGTYQQAGYKFSYDFEEGDKGQEHIGELHFAPDPNCESRA